MSTSCASSEARRWIHVICRDGRLENPTLLGNRNQVPSIHERHKTHPWVKERSSLLFHPVLSSPRSAAPTTSLPMQHPSYMRSLTYSPCSPILLVYHHAMFKSQRVEAGEIGIRRTRKWSTCGVIRCETEQRGCQLRHRCRCIVASREQLSFICRSGAMKGKRFKGNGHRDFCISVLPLSLCLFTSSSSLSVLDAVMWYLLAIVEDGLLERIFMGCCGSGFPCLTLC
jgi:hypothetical protein